MTVRSKLSGKWWCLKCKQLLDSLFFLVTCLDRSDVFGPDMKTETHNETANAFKRGQKR